MISVDADTMQAAITLAQPVTLGHAQARGRVDTERREVWSAGNTAAADGRELRMRAGDLAQPFATVTPGTGALAATKAMAAARQPGLIVCGHDGRPYTILPGSQVLRLLIPDYLQQTPALARALDESASQQLCRRLEHLTVRDLLPHPRDVDELPVVDRDATPLEVAAVMARMHSPVVAVVDGEGETGRVEGAITASGLLEHLLAPGAEQP
jgi:hypothetical protein